jgi:hypothetical protein
MSHRFIRTIVACVGLSLVAGTSRAADAVGFYDDIKPILSVHCYKCHGPDVAKGGLRLDDREAAFNKETKSKSVAIVPGDVARSEMLRRVASDDPNERMT